MRTFVPHTVGMEDLEAHRRVLRDLVSASGDISVLARQLGGFQGWDVEPLVTLGRPDIVSILERYLRGELSADEVGIWADALEVRDDVEYGDDRENGVLTAVFQLANQGMGACPVTPQEARRLIAELRSQPDPGHTHGGGQADPEEAESMVRGAVFVMEDHDIELYADVEAAARELEGYAAQILDYVGADGTVYMATVEGPEWGPVTLHPTQDNRLDDLVRLLRSEAEHRGLSLPPGTPAEPVAIWRALEAAQHEQQQERRRSRGRWWKPWAKAAPPEA